MSALRPELGLVLRELLRQSEAGGSVELDAIGAAIGTLAVSTDEIEALFDALAAEGREISAPHAGAERALKQVVAAARKLKSVAARRPTLAEVAAEAQLSERQVLMALSLLRVMQR